MKAHPHRGCKRAGFGVGGYDLGSGSLTPTVRTTDGRWHGQRSTGRVQLSTWDGQRPTWDGQRSTFMTCVAESRG
jgi:hypothetical protein